MKNGSSLNFSHQKLYNAQQPVRLNNFCNLYVLKCVFIDIVHVDKLQEMLSTRTGMCEAQACSDYIAIYWKISIPFGCKEGPFFEDCSTVTLELILKSMKVLC